MDNGPALPPPGSTPVAMIPPPAPVAMSAPTLAPPMLAPPPLAMPAPDVSLFASPTLAPPPPSALGAHVMPSVMPMGAPAMTLAAPPSSFDAPAAAALDWSAPSAAPVDTMPPAPLFATELESRLREIPLLTLAGGSPKPTTPMPIGAPFAPPSNAGAQWPQTPLLGEVPLAPSPKAAKKKRGRRLAGLFAAVAVVAGSAGAAWMIRGGESADAYSLSHSAESAQNVKGAALEMTIKYGDQVSTTASAVIDGTTGRMKMTADYSTISGQSGVGEVEMYIDLQNKTMYYNAEQMGLSGVTTEYVSLSLTDVAADSGSTVAIDPAKGANPLDVAPLLAVAESVEDLGFEQVNGEKVKHYEVTLDQAAALGVSEESKSEVGDAVLDVVVYDVYVSEDNQLRRMVYDYTIAGQTIGFDVLVTALSEAPEIVLPTSEQTTDMTEFFPTPD